MKLIDELYDTIRFVNETPNAVFDMDKIEDIFAAIEDKLQFYEKLEQALEIIRKNIGLRRLSEEFDYLLNMEEYNLLKEVLL